MTPTERRIPVEELIQFPTRFSFKAVGRNHIAFAEAAVLAAKAVLGSGRRVEYRTRASRASNYLSVTLTAEIETAAELRAVYSVLRQLPDVITVL